MSPVKPSEGSFGVPPPARPYLAEPYKLLSESQILSPKHEAIQLSSKSQERGQGLSENDVIREQTDLQATSEFRIKSCYLDDSHPFPVPSVLKVSVQFLLDRCPSRKGHQLEMTTLFL